MIVERGRAVGHSTKYRIVINCSQVDDSTAINCSQSNYSQNGNCSQADHRTIAKNDVNYGQVDHLTTQELPIKPLSSSDAFALTSGSEVKPKRERKPKDQSEFSAYCDQLLQGAERQDRELEPSL
jgi:hypothetical protein